MSTAFYSNSLKRKSASVDYGDSAKADLETEEAGSILVSLSQYKPKMSISNLLDTNSNDQHEHLNKPDSWHKNKRASAKQPNKPRIRRCALQAYISYKTYSDLARKKKKQQQHLTPLRNKIVEQPLTDFLHQPVRLPPIVQRNHLQ